MKTLALSQAAKAVNGKLTGSDVNFKGVYTDSRKPIKGGLFVALEGDRFDGHDFVKNAEKDGASAVLCRKTVECSLPVIYVNDTGEALLNLASWYRGLFNIHVVGLTGSVGKTTTKEMTALVMASEFRTIKTEGNLNNNIGMPMTLFTVNETTEAAVIEMGMNHFGEISTLTRACRPDVGIITNIGVSHIENLGSRENILKSKLEILEGMKKGSPLILNGDNDLLSQYRNEDYDIMFFGIENENCQVRAVDINEKSGFTEFNILFGGKKYETVVPVQGIHNVYDALAAFSAGIKTGISPENASLSIKNYVPTGMRQKTIEKSGITFIEDCYNASPDSVKAGVNTLMSVKANRHIAVLGDMLELGSYSEKAHSDSGKYALQKKVDILFAYGKDSMFTAKEAEKSNTCHVYHTNDESELSSMLLEMLMPGDAVLFKASRGMKLENVIHNIYAGLEKDVKGGNKDE